MMTTKNKSNFGTTFSVDSERLPAYNMGFVNMLEFVQAATLFFQRYKFIF